MITSLGRGDKAARLVRRVKRGILRRMTIRHEPDAARFVAAAEGGEATLYYAERGDGVVDFQSTFTPPALRGRGIATALVVHALEWARGRGLRVIPSCWFVGRVVARRPEYRDLVIG
jgi:predicted GNAT family acetyltransferase